MRGSELTRRSLLAALAGAGVAHLAESPARALGALTGHGARQWGSGARSGGAPVAAIDRGSRGAPVLFEERLGTVAGEVAVRARAPFALVGVQWRGAPHAGLWLRTAPAPGRWSRWARASHSGHGPDGAEAQRARAALDGRSTAEPLWCGRARLVQLRTATPLRDVSLHFVDPGGVDPGGVGSGGVDPGAAARSPRALAAGGLPLAEPLLDAGPGQPPIIARAAWAHGSSPPSVTPEYGRVQLAFVHHTENPNGYSAAEVPAMLRAIYVFHRFVRGWDDIGYNFVIDTFGRIFEARAGGIDEPVVGAQAGGYNLVSTGVAVLGDFMSVPISAAAQGALGRLLAWKLSLHGVPIEGRATVRVDPAGAVWSRFPGNARVTLPTVAGHRDADTTDCPGNALYGQLPALRHRAAALAGRPLRLTLAAVGAPRRVPASAPPATAPLGATPPATTPPVTPSPPELSQQVEGALTYLDGRPLAGVSVEIQARVVAHRGEVVKERTVAMAGTDGRGRFQASLPVRAHAAGHAHARHAHAHAHAQHAGPTTWLRALWSGSHGVPAAVSAPVGLSAELLPGARSARPMVGPGVWRAPIGAGARP